MNEKKWTGASSSSNFASEVTIPKPVLSASSSPSLERKHSIANSTYSENSATLAPSRRTDWYQKSKSIFFLLLSKYWFLLGLAIAIILAWQFPDVAKKGGYIRGEWSIKWGAVIIIFLISGLSLKTQTLAQTVLRVRLHLLIQVINLLVIPGVVFGLVLLFLKMHMPINSLLLVGLVIAASTPTTVSSNVVMTKNADGNEASALMNAAIGNVLGIFVSPALVSVFQGPLIDATPEEEPATEAGGKVDFVSVLKQLGLTVLVPLVVGQIIQWLFTEKVAKIKAKYRLSDISSVALLTLVWSVFSDAVASGSFSSIAAVDIVAILIINAGLYISFSLLCWFLGSIPAPYPGPQWVQRLRYSRADTVAIMYCGATKTVAMGVPLINVLFQTGDPGTVGVLATPLLLYHIEQLILGNIEVEILKKWVHRGRQQDDIEKQQEQQQGDEDDTGEIPIPSTHDSQDMYGSGTTRIPSSLLPSHLAQSNITPHPFTTSHLEKEPMHLEK